MKQLLLAAEVVEDELFAYLSLRAMSASAVASKPCSTNSCASQPYVLMASPKAPFATVHELIAYARTNPGTLN